MKPRLHDLISKPYRRELLTLHRAPRGFGGKGHKWADLVHQLKREHKLKSVLDYGAGRGALGEELAARKIKVRSYDPGVKRFSAFPKSSDLVACTDVMEHVEPENVDAVLAHIAALTRRLALFVISLIEGHKLLSDGRDAHISLHPREWWLSKLSERFEIIQTLDDPDMRPEKQLVVIVAPKGAQCANSR